MIDFYTLIISQIKEDFQSQNEFVVVENFLSESDLNIFINVLPLLETSINRNYIPGHKKGGSVSKYSLDSLAPVFGEFYQSPVLFDFLSKYY